MKQCNYNTKIDSPPKNNETPQKFLWWLAIVLRIFKRLVWKHIFEDDYYSFTKGD